MNGEVNGTMEVPMEASDNSPISNKRAVSEEYNSNESTESHCDNSNNSETSNHLNESKGNQAKSNGELIDNEQGDSYGDHQPDSCNIDQEDSKDPLSNHCSNSNDSCSNSVQSSTKNDDNSLMSEKSKHAHYDQTCDKSATNMTEDSGEDEGKEESSDEEGSVLSAGEGDAVVEADTVSINSDSDSDVNESLQESKGNNRHSDIIILENDDRPGSQNGKSASSGSPDVQEILSDNDDCVVTDEKSNSSNSENKTQLRRSNRAIKRKAYNDLVNGDEESDVEEIEMDDPLDCRNKSIIINDTKKNVEMVKIKLNQGNQKKEPTVVIIDSNNAKASPSLPKTVPVNLSANAQTLYQSIVACGTTVTPVKGNSSTQSCPPAASQVSILPSLTDDMFVVEAPSFIVPYVYEKPSVKPFREFVDILGKQLEEQRAKEEKEKVEKEREEKEKREKEKKDRRERGEEVSEDEVNTIAETENEEKKLKKAERKERRKRRNDDDDASWDGETSSDSEDETLSDEDNVVLKDKEDSIEEIKDITDLTADKVGSVKTDNYFDCSLGKFFVTIGFNLVQEYVQNDLLKQENRKLNREKKTGNCTKATQSSIASLKKNLEFSKENNAPYNFLQKKCEFCTFKSESTLVMQHHLETPHMKNNLYKCNFCSLYVHKQPHEILLHMQEEHKVRGRLERAPSYHQCPNCPFEENGKGKFARHQIACAKKFKPEANLAPPIEWEPPAKIPKISKARNVVNSYQSAINRQVSINRPIAIANMMPGASGGFRPRGRSPMAATPRAAPVHGAPIMRGGLMIRHNSASSTLVPNNYPVANNGKTKSQPSISITPLPRQAAPVIPQTTPPAKSTFVICEICDGYIKDLEQLRNHMQWIHKVKIHPKMIYNRPPLNCQKCQFRFFTDQGLERHLLGSHGLVTSSMQEAANKGKDAGRCPVCGRVYQWKLLNHVARDHNLTLKPAHLSYKCTVCTATFGMYKQFENHVYSAHSVVAKRVMDKNKSSAAAKPAIESTPKPLKINDEITIIPQPAKSATSTST